MVAAAAVLALGVTLVNRFYMPNRAKKMCIRDRYLIPGVRVSQVLSAVLIVVGLGIAWGIRSGRLRSKTYEGKYLLDNVQKNGE